MIAPQTVNCSVCGEPIRKNARCTIVPATLSAYGSSPLQRLRHPLCVHVNVRQNPQISGSMDKR